LTLKPGGKAPPPDGRKSSSKIGYGPTFWHVGTQHPRSHGYTRPFCRFTYPQMDVVISRGSVKHWQPEFTNSALHALI
jgi:hypothetical protein